MPFDVRVIERVDELHFGRQGMTRRDFFGRVRLDAKSRLRRVTEALDSRSSTAYRAKKVPLTRTALNAALDTLDQNGKNVLLSHRYCSLAVTADCGDCALCVALCPTGALAKRRQSDSIPGGLCFNTRLCTNCGLCAEACPEKGIVIKGGVITATQHDGELVFVQGEIEERTLLQFLELRDADASTGAQSVFMGRVRADEIGGQRVVALEYEAYREMAGKESTRVLAETREAYNLKSLAVCHSLGRVDSGRVCIVVVATAEHREPAIDGCREAVERIKQEVPIFAKELLADGTYAWKRNRFGAPDGGDNY